MRIYFTLPVLLLFLLFCLPGFVSAQDIQHDLNVNIARAEFKARQVIPPSPEASELGKYGNLPMNLFTGTPNINIPLYELKGQSLSLPISLSFNATGFKPEELASWVGQNWSLNAGGVVTRAVMGNPDNDNNYYRNDSTLGIPPLNDLFALFDYQRSTQVAEKDAQPDYYYYNFGNNSGKYLIRPNGVVLKKTKNNLAINHNDRTSPTITDEQGNVYTFSDEETTRMVLNDDAEPEGPTVLSYTFPSSWFLSAVTSADGNEQLTFEYYSTTGEQPVYQNILQNESVTYTVTTRGAQVTKSTESYKAVPPEIHILRKFLKRISLIRKGQVVAYADIISSNTRSDASFPEDRLVQGINIYNNVNNNSILIKKYIFYSGYFTNPGNQLSKNRLRLDSLKEIAVSGTATVPPYEFSYNQDYQMPDISTGGIDHWGFYNGYGNNSLVPNRPYGEVTVGKGANRTPSNAAKFGLLTKIKYPTGGFTVFEYEGNKATTTSADLPSGDIGGLRIKSMTDMPTANSKAVTRTYEYLSSDGSSSGRVSPRFPDYTKTTGYIDYELSVGHTETASSGKFTVSATSIFGLGTVQGSHIGYETVTEYVTDPVSSQSLGKTVYEYHIGNWFFDDISSGDLERKSIYDNSGKLLQETTNSYNYTDVEWLDMLKTTPSSAQSSKTIYCKKVNPNGGYTYQRYSPSETVTGCVATRNYSIDLLAGLTQFPCQAKDLALVTVKEFDKTTNAYITTSTRNTYTSLKHTYPSLIEQLTTSGDKAFTQKKYAADYVIPGTADIISKGIGLLQSKNINGAEIESAQYRQNADGSNTRYLSGSYTVYSNIIPAPLSLFRLETATPLTNFQETKVSAAGVFSADSRYKPMATFKYNTSGNLTEQTKTDDITTSYIWDYKSLFPVAEVSNADTNVIAYTGFETDANPDAYWTVTGGAKDTVNAFTGARSYNLKTGGLISKINSIAITRPLMVTYWSRNGAITVTQNAGTAIPVKVTGPTFNGWTLYKHLLPAGTQQVKLTAANATIDELRLYPADAQMQTYSYAPFVGLTSKTGPADLSSYFEYDGLGRLVNAKDFKGQIVQNYRYNYGPGLAMTAPDTSLYYNAALQANFTRASCDSGEAGIITYSVPYGRYSSAISQADANAKAQQDLNTNGQAYANANAPCWFYNVRVSRVFTKTDCPPDRGDGLPYDYIVEARKHRSTISQASANYLAQQDILNNGQWEANAHGHCFCEGLHTKIIKGICETGVKQYVSSLPDPQGGYKCLFVYIWSDGSHTETYSERQPSPCPID
ncbi:DUF5977 domain-containing protein [Chitinophaga sp. 22321]|uniref:DUF5977 domain-containing protein n=1 Tax=Chitinophaga hostae TaxID=2831022 RepID=A0ABS5J4A5_9BACT|nr:DUF5977 domain-containing protein [Chitinophaga hostae]MBS0030044.1 hypothetical protein [Chitinophaga hostae]